MRNNYWDKCNSFVLHGIIHRSVFVPNQTLSSIQMQLRCNSLRKLSTAASNIHHQTYWCIWNSRNELHIGAARLHDVWRPSFVYTLRVALSIQILRRTHITTTLWPLIIIPARRHFRLFGKLREADRCGISPNPDDHRNVFFIRLL